MKKPPKVEPWVYGRFPDWYENHLNYLAMATLLEGNEERRKEFASELVRLALPPPLRLRPQTKKQLRRNRKKARE